MKSRGMKSKVNRIKATEKRLGAASKKLGAKQRELNFDKAKDKRMLIDLTKDIKHLKKK